MYAVVETGGKQVKVEPGKLVKVEKLAVPVGEGVIFEKVLLVRDEASTRVGTPYLEDTRVSGKVVDQVRDRKIIVFKHKRRKNYKRKMGHRQFLTVVAIESIDVAAKQAES